MSEKLSKEDTEIIFMQDSYTLLYSTLGRALIDCFGLEGEAILREGTRAYGKDRGVSKRNQHLAAGYKVNMENLFTIGGDLPPDPRFKRELQRLNPEERVSHTLCCPMADVWNAAGEKEIGRIYCEEFHYACYNSYGYGLTKVNLARTLTQDDDYCSFSILLRPYSMPEDLRKFSFTQFDPTYTGPIKSIEENNAKVGFGILCIKIYSHLLKTAVEEKGSDGIDCIQKGLFDQAMTDAIRIRDYSVAHNSKINQELLERIYPVSFMAKEELWDRFEDINAHSLYQTGYVEPLLRHLGLEVGVDH